MKIFRLIKSSSDSVFLQNYLNFLSVWCKHNNLSLNIDKHKIVLFSWSCTQIISEYILDNIVLQRLIDYHNLCDTFNSSPIFGKRYLNISKRSSSTLGSNNRTCKDFANPDALKPLYFSLLRSTLEFKSTEWSPSANVHK